MSVLDLDDIQGFVLRGYAMPALRVFVLRIVDPNAGRSLLGALAGGDPALRVTSAGPWGEKPPRCFNVGITFEGLRALHVADVSLRSFPVEFAEGAAARAARVGDAGASAPERWIGGLGSSDVHLVVTCFAVDAAALEAATVELRSCLASPDGLQELSHHDGGALPGHVAHFGYRDGFSQPTIEGAPPTHFADRLPVAPAGEFLFGYPSQHPGFSYPVPTPEALGRNGSFMALRLLEQDVAGFEAFLVDAGRRLGLHPELVAAKLCGRWRNGVPLALSPDTDAPEPGVPEELLNDFDYAGNGQDDPRGVRCPIGAHIRRTNPRSSRVAGGGGNLHRLVRRGLPFGPPFEPGQPPDGHARGLVGMFIGVSLADQFEFVMAEWVNSGRFAPGLGSSTDPLIGGGAEHQRRFTIPADRSASLSVGGFARFVRTLGGAYCFLPSLGALGVLAAGE